MASYDYGKAEVVGWIKEHFNKNDTCLDVGACDGKWSELVGDYLIMDACEIYKPNIWDHELWKKYRDAFCNDIADLEYDYYDLVIFGDVIEHMTVEKAQRVLAYAKDHCKDMIVGVPFLYKQGELYGNPYEKHIQDDLTPELFDQRYEGFELICRPIDGYAYYHKKPDAGLL